MLTVNLVPDSIVALRREANVIRLGKLALIVTVAFMAVLTAASFTYATMQSNHLDNAKEDYKQAKAAANTEEQIATRKSVKELQVAVDGAEYLISTQQRMTQLLEDLGEYTPIGVSYSELSVDGENAFSVTARAASYSDIAKMVAKMISGQDSPFYGVTIDGANENDGNGYNFTILGSYNFNPPVTVEETEDNTEPDQEAATPAQSEEQEENGTDGDAAQDSDADMPPPPPPPVMEGN